ncbi:unnamed protein product [Sphagnum tenellum]
MNILIEVKTVYGKEAIYPVCANAKTFAEIAGSKTLTRATLAKIAKLGFSIGVQYAPNVIVESRENLQYAAEQMFDGWDHEIEVWIEAGRPF